MVRKIFIDPGHGGTDPGAVNGSRLEKTDNLNFSLALIKRLKENGFDVNQSRTTDGHVTLENRTKSANNWKADLFISIHRNSFTNSTANGVETWIYTQIDQTTKNFANYIQQELVNVYAQSNRGVKSGNLYVTRTTTMPAVLIELGFISNTLDNQKFDEHFNAYVEAVVKAVCKGFGINYSSRNSSSSGNNGSLWKVQVGAFSNKANADNLLLNLKNQGYDAFITQN